jgi:diguanylate cyclase (GGDEF)-like protein
MSQALIDREEAGEPPRDPLRDALLESRQRWRDLVAMAGDIAFETDAWGRFVFAFPDPALGWSASGLIGQPSELLLADATASAGYNPFRPTAAVRRRRCWVRRGDGALACVSFAAAPLLDAEGRIIGARGVGVDESDEDDGREQVSAALRRGEVIDHVLFRMRQEVLAPRMMQAALDGLYKALGAEGAAVAEVGIGGAGPRLAHQVGGAGAAVLGTAVSLLRGRSSAPAHATTPEGRPVLVAACHTRFGGDLGLVLWRTPGSRPWDADDHMLACSAAGIIGVILEHEAIQQEMVDRARTDPLTGLLNRRAFMEELVRHADRLDRDELPGTLMFVDLDNFKPVNDRLGHAAGDRALCLTASLLRDLVRPTDLVARLGGDEFALWMNGADELTAAERAEFLRVDGPAKLAPLTDGRGPALTMSIGIACRTVGSFEPIESVLRRADAAMYEVKRSGRAHWRVSHLPSPIEGP